jgi:chemotaxis protein MotB
MAPNLHTSVRNFSEQEVAMRNLSWRISFLTIFLFSSLTGCVTTSTFEAKEKEAAQAWNELKAAQEAIRNLNEVLETTKAEGESVERRLNNELTAARDAIWNLTEVLETTKVERDTLESRLKEVGRSLEAANGRIAELERTLSSQREDIARLSQVSTSKDEQINLLQSTHDRLVTDLKREIEAGEIKVSQYKDLLTVNLVEKILFDSGKIEIKSRGLEVLKRVGEILKNTTNKEIRIAGHTDNVPIGPVLAAKYPTNWELSAARATVVARYFLDKVDIPPEKLAPTGYGQYRPVASNDTLEERAQNRRIEIILAPLSYNVEVN